MGRDVSIDASDMPAYGNGQRFVSKGGRERERFSDSDASWGHRSAVSTRKGGGFYGFRLHAAVCSLTGLPLAWEVQSARQHESLSVEPLLAALASRGINPATVALDRDYDAEFVHEACESRGIAPIIPLKQTLREARRSPCSDLRARHVDIRGSRLQAQGVEVALSDWRV